MPDRHSLKFRLTVLIGSLAILTALGLSFMVSRFAHDQISRDQGALLEHVANAMVSRLAQDMYTRGNELQFLAGMEAIRSRNTPPEQKQALFESMKRAYPYYAWIGMTDADGNILAGTQDLLEGKSVAKRDWFLHGSQGLHFGDAHDAFLLAKLMPKPKWDDLPLRLVDVSVPVLDESGNLVGVICGHLSLDWAFEVRNRMLDRFPKDQLDLVVLNREGKVLMGTPELPSLEVNLSGLASFSAAGQGRPHSTIEVWPNGQRYLTSAVHEAGYQNYPGMGWTVVARTSEDLAFAPAHRLNDIIIALGAVTTVLFAVLLWQILTRNLRPLEAISEAARRIRDQDLSAPIPQPGGKGELAVFARSLTALVSTLQARNAELRLAGRVFAESGQGILICDADKRILRVNRAFEKITGYSEAEVIGQTPALLRSGRHGPEFYEAMWRRIHATGSWQGEIWNRNKAGAIFPEWLTINVLRDPSGTITHYIGIFDDITARKAAESELERHRYHLEELVAERTEALVATEQKYRLILESSADGIFGLDTEGNFSFVNPSACHTLGYSADQLIGRPSHGTIHGLHEDNSVSPDSECAILASLRDGKLVSADDEVFRHADGHPIPVLYSTHPMLRDGKVEGLVVNFVDITDRRVLDEAREAALAEARRLARTRSEFLANMSHEIRTPLNGVLGFAQIGYRRSTAGWARDMFGKILDSGRLLMGIINDILDVSKIEAGRLHLESTAVDLHRILDDVMELQSYRAQDKGLQLRLDKMADLPETCLGDPLRLQQVLLNLMANALKFTDQGRVVLHAGLQGDTLEFQVEDTGIGMTEDQKVRIFSPFEQGDSSTTRRFGGTGLGLTIVRSLVELMGGSLKVASNPGEGSLFTVRLPYQPVSPAALEASDPDVVGASPGQRLTGLRILAAEDNEVNQAVLEEMLAEEGCRLDLVGDGHQAIEQVREAGPGAYHLVLMDVQMPVMDGFESTSKIHDLDPGLPVLGQTAYAMAEEREKCLAAGMVDRVTKPLDQETLVAAILKHRRGRNPVLSA